MRLLLKPYDFQAVVPKTGGIPLRTRPEPRRSYHALELDRRAAWKKALCRPLLDALVAFAEPYMPERRPDTRET